MDFDKNTKHKKWDCLEIFEKLWNGIMSDIY